MRHLLLAYVCVLVATAATAAVDLGTLFAYKAVWTEKAEFFAVAHAK